ncbi:MAG: beta-galactosidase, partial [Mucilaginibacter polytrichastri]|nr:beta-galactosidase [Mucilaginibacter polytrichastri]
MKNCFKSMLFTALGSAIVIPASAQKSTWKPAGDRIKTEWAAKVDPAKTLPEYPRPQLKRENWQNLNGLWDYAITPKNAAKPASFAGKILVPFAVESSLSGVEKTVGKDSVLWYHAVFTAKKSGKRTLLHFGAVDWRSEIWVNGKKAGSHEGGFDPFTLDITPHLKGSKIDLVVKVWDPTDEGPQPRGKQQKKPEGIWYTPVTGIWQTVWLEGVPESYIASTKQTPDIDSKTLSFSADVDGARSGDLIKVTVMDGTKKVKEQSFAAKSTAKISINDPKLWSPESPFLYDLKVELTRGGKKIDEVSSYFAMRKSSIGVDDKGIKRMLLNNKFVFQFGPLDQGWWPDGLYT